MEIEPIEEHNPSDYIALNEAVRQLNRDPATIKKYIRNGVIKGYKDQESGKWYVAKEELNSPISKLYTLRKSRLSEETGLDLVVGQYRSKWISDKNMRLLDEIKKLVPAGERYHLNNAIHQYCTQLKNAFKQSVEEVVEGKKAPEPGNN